MQKEIVELNKKEGTFRVTLPGERWYTLPVKDKITGLPTYKYVPSVTWIAGFYPKGIQFYKWLAQKGWDEAEAIKQAAGDKGSKVHQAVEALINGREISMNEYIPNPSTGEPEELTVEEYDCLLSFKEWVDQYQPTFLKQETTVISRKYGYAGTVDAVCKIGEDIYIIDFKTSQSIWTEYELQISAYKQALIEEDPDLGKAKLAILQLGYKRNKHNYKFTEVDDKFGLFLNAYAIWKHDTEGQAPKQKDYPMSIKLNVNKLEKTYEGGKKSINKRRLG